MPLGTTKMQVKVPDVPVVNGEQLEIVAPSNTSDSSGVATENPFPGDVHRRPPRPLPGCHGDRRNGHGECARHGLAPASVAVTTVPKVPVGTLNVHENDPALPVVSEPVAQLAIDTPWTPGN